MPEAATSKTNFCVFAVFERIYLTMDLPKRLLRMALPIGLLLLASIVIPFKLWDGRGLDRVRRLEGELADLKEKNAQIRRENEALRTEIRAFHSDPTYVEKVARDELGMVGDNEIIYQFPNMGK